jgi:hypothetical protein
MMNKPPLSFSTTPSHTKSVFKAFKHPITTKNAPTHHTLTNRPKPSDPSPTKPPHTSTSQPKQKYMSFLKKKNLKIDLPEDSDAVSQAPISTTHLAEKRKNLELDKQIKKPMSTKNASNRGE